MRRTKEYHDLIDAVGELAGALTETFNVILDLINIAFSGLFGEIGKTDHVYSFRDAIRAVFSIFTALLRVVTGAVKVFNELLTMMRDSSPFRRFWEELGRMIDRAIEKAGKFGRALIALKNGDFKGAWEIISGDGDGSPAGKGDRDWNRKVAYQRFKAAGYSDEAIAGILGRMQQEHNFDTSDVPEHYVPGIGTVGGYGMYQLNGGRTQRFLAWAEEHGLDPQDPGVQTDFAIIEARERGLGPEYMNQLSPSEATTVWTDKYEVGKHGDEQAYTAEQYADIQSGRILEAQPTQPVSAPADASPAAGNMSYKLERPHYRATPVSTFAAPSYSIDPLLYTGLMTGARQTGYGGYQPTGSGNGSVVYQVNVGGVTVNGTNQNAAEIGRSVGRETMTQLEQKGAHILRSRTMTGAPVLV